jgi:hypothetical protein
MTLVTYHTGCKQSLLAVLAHRHIVLAVLAVAASILAVLAIAAGHVLAIGHFIPSLAIFIWSLPGSRGDRHPLPAGAPAARQSVPDPLEWPGKS